MIRSYMKFCLNVDRDFGGGTMMERELEKRSEGDRISDICS